MLKIFLVDNESLLSEITQRVTFLLLFVKTKNFNINFHFNKEKTK